MKIFRTINYMINKAGVELIKYPQPDFKRRMMLLKHFEITKIFDIGANIGDYAKTLRQLGFAGEIVSFEPLSNTFKTLVQNSKKDNKWFAINIALGDKDEESEINIAGNINSSSLLEMLPNHINSAPQSIYIGKEKIIVAKIDTILDSYHKKGDQLFIKIDTQGFEKNVIDGAQKSLSKIKGMQIEMSLIPLYKGGFIYLEMIDFMRGKGFNLYSLENGFSDPKSGQLLQVDGIFFKTL